MYFLPRVPDNQYTRDTGSGNPRAIFHSPGYPHDPNHATLIHTATGDGPTEVPGKMMISYVIVIVLSGNNRTRRLQSFSSRYSVGEP
jgi:hypothetical protein